MSRYSWTWDGATPRERGIWVRGHMAICRHDLGALCKLFNLTPEGAQSILDGADWAPEHRQTQLMTEQR